ncbi:hypothetical protein [Selenomonas sp. oral taxon 892]|uniref:hypothetical protein n=1 Tax=Selenomonas sp. oral taxon 892 TaxID=1321785 RepID=UPI000569101F|nr:hypothetical protein [Selenomonas sp. oral taxon 892]
MALHCFIKGSTDKFSCAILTHLFLLALFRQILHIALAIVRFVSLFGRKNLRQSDGLHFISDSLKALLHESKNLLMPQRFFLCKF